MLLTTGDFRRICDTHCKPVNYRRLQQACHRLNVELEQKEDGVTVFVHQQDVFKLFRFFRINLTEEDIDKNPYLGSVQGIVK